MSDKYTLILLVLSVGLTPSPLMSMFTDMADVSATGRINKHSFLLAAAGYLCVNFEIRGAGSELSKHWRHRDEYLFIRHRYYYYYYYSLLLMLHFRAGILRAKTLWGETSALDPVRGSSVKARKGTNGVSTNGVIANFIFFDRGTFWLLPLTCFYLRKVPGRNFFPKSVKIHYFCSGPVSVDPICPQPSN